MIRVYYANRLWGEYPNVIDPLTYLEIPGGSYIRGHTGEWFMREENGYLDEEDVPKETRLLDLLNSD